MEKSIVEIEEFIRYLDWKIRRKGRGILKDEELTQLQFYALQMIKYQEGKATPTYLTNLLKVAASTVSDMIKKMENGGYIKKLSQNLTRDLFILTLQIRATKS